MSQKSKIWQEIGWRFEALVYDLFVGVLRLLPLDTASDMGGWLLGALGPLTSIHKTVMRNLRLAFPDMTEAEREDLAHKQWVNTGRTFAEFPLIDRIAHAPGRMIVEGEARLKAIAASGRPVVVISVHQSNWELVPAAVLAAGIPFLVTYRAANNPHVDKRIIAGRRRYGVELFGPKGSDGAREMLQALDQGTSIGLMNDQKFNRGVPGTFFGHPVETAPGPTRLAQRFGTVLQPISVRRTHKARFVVTVHDPIEIQDTGSKSGDIAATVDRINAFVEAVVRENPAEWFWTHKRWPDAVYAALNGHQK